MSCPWPMTEADVDLEAALDIALDYLEGTGQIHPLFETLQVCTTAIIEAWRRERDIGFDWPTAPSRPLNTSGRTPP